jgi:hypothetical protein
MGLTRPRDVAASGVTVTYYLFDLLRLEGADTTRLSLRTRKSLLRRALTYRAPLRLSTHRNEGGSELLADACARGWEGRVRAACLLVAGRGEGELAPLVIAPQGVEYRRLRVVHGECPPSDGETA